jgi:hypothetical protein
MASRSAAAAAFEETLVELGIDEGDPEIGDARKLGRRGALLAVAGTVWRRHLGPLLNTRQVAELLGVGSRQAVHDRVRRHRILALSTEERELAYPAFQFNEKGEPYAAIGMVLEAFAGAVLSPHTVASWFLTPQTALDGATPAAWMAEGRDAERLVTAARRSASRAAR